jgi:hypothetical protein
MKDTFSVPDDRIDDERVAVGYALDDDGGLAEQGGSEFDDLVGSGSFYTTVSDLCLYDRALRANSLISEASMREALTSGRTNEGKRTECGFGWYLGTYNDMPFADHEGAWTGFRTYMCRYLDRPLSLFVLSNRPEIEFADIANVATDAFVGA